MYKKVIPKTEIHWWYTKEAYMLTYKHKIQLWKVEASHAMLPPNVVKQVGRPKSKRDRELDEARKRKGEWSQSRKGTQMTCSNCGEPNHNAKGCYKVEKLMTRGVPTGTRKISFTGDHTGVSVRTNLPYSPFMIT
ncbi:putative TGACG-sequence-specific DNA-binding protein TGA-2.1-like [Capsicum annuum]|uniref:CCHC-type domain-containing protein n=1 Tax=Capsicum annuum TaxID=4072 RepID=A0A2G2ZY53_CAPAN|nr:putative TGACG-sequence-specific DNA-binding protein TGA-2.1-like [Capsicum annuum]KAF3681225.1 putative TGACG-sequence-specific DNA-binding protein TGA-2.1-like [Capsicum annuum]PHT86917.1 hypothetical protein T459_09023 [Capsicum annuum]